MRHDLRETVVELFTSKFGRSPSWLAKAPGRLEILGNHTDYNEGFVLSAATNLATAFAILPVEGTLCEIFSGTTGGMTTFDVNGIDAPVPRDWANYVKGVVKALRKRGHNLGGFKGAVLSDVPLSAGMSSSAALEISACFAIGAAFGITLPPEEWARVGQSAENEFIGVKTGLLDQFSSIFGRKDKLIMTDFREVRVVKEVALPSDYVFVVANTMVKHDLVESDYNLRRESCERAASAIKEAHPNVRTLRDVDLALLNASKELLTTTDFRRASHIVGENTRVLDAVNALAANDIGKFGKLLFDSHMSSVENFENSCPELDYLVELAQTLPGCVGARLSGGGFGGITIHLLRSDLAAQYRERVSTAFLLKTGKEATTLICQTGDGAMAEKL